MLFFPSNDTVSPTRAMVGAYTITVSPAYASTALINSPFCVFPLASFT
jgi:hypothetical protein